MDLCHDRDTRSISVEGPSGLSSVFSALGSVAMVAVAGASGARRVASAAGAPGLSVGWLPWFAIGLGGVVVGAGGCGRRPACAVGLDRCHGPSRHSESGRGLDEESGSRLHSRVSHGSRWLTARRGPAPGRRT